jgi:hypothetical protein
VRNSFQNYFSNPTCTATARVPARPSRRRKRCSAPARPPRPPRCGSVPAGCPPRASCCGGGVFVCATRLETVVLCVDTYRTLETLQCDLTPVSKPLFVFIILPFSRAFSTQLLFKAHYAAAGQARHAGAPAADVRAGRPRAHGARVRGRARGCLARRARARGGAVQLLNPVVQLLST